MNGPQRIIYLNIGAELVDCLGRARRCSVFGEGVKLGAGFEVSETQVRHCLSVCCLQIGCKLQCHAGLIAAMLPVIMLMD